jgi:phosphate transport system permease protein
MTVASPNTDFDDTPRTVTISRTRGDSIFRRISIAAGFSTFVIMALIGTFLLVRAIPAFHLAGLHFFTEQLWRPDEAHPVFGIAAVLFGTVTLAIIALVFAVPVSIATALFVNEYAPLRVRRPLTGLIDLLAAVPSLIFGLWGLFFLQPQMLGLSRWLSSHLGFIPIFHVTKGAVFASSPFIAGVVLSLMIVPIITSVTREVFSQAPPGEKEGALALGATRWGMIRTVVLPFGRGGIIGGSMLGLGRALGETIAVALILSPAFVVSPHVLQPTGNSVASLIALRFGEAKHNGLSALMAAGLSLFVLTLLVNIAASAVVARSRSGKGVEI